ncbi:MAG: acyl-CoA thioesterase [Actinomycetota bacterium]|nr:acyl-CoA thioesterase [Actinomycetota bacterium]
MAEPFRHTLRVRYAECDAQGVVFNAHYLAYVDHTITELWRTTFGGYQAMLDRGVDIVVAEAQLRFLGAARFDQELAIEAAVTHLGTTSLRTVYRFYGGGELVLTAALRHVFVDAGTSTKTPIPDWAREGLGRWLRPELDPAAVTTG